MNNQKSCTNPLGDCDQKSKKGEKCLFHQKLHKKQKDVMTEKQELQLSSVVNLVYMKRTLKVFAPRAQ